MYFCFHVIKICFAWQMYHIIILYRMVKNVGGKKLWRKCFFGTLAKKTLANLEAQSAFNNKFRIPNRVYSK